MKNYSLLITWSIVIASYILPSALLPKDVFYKYSILWSSTIALSVLFIAKIKTDLTWKKISILVSVMAGDYFLVRKFSPQIVPINVFAGVVMAPLAEELFFRGWVLSKLTGSNKDKIIKSSILFGLYHLKNTFVMSPFGLFHQVLYSGLFVGPVLSWIRLKYNTLFYPMLLHSVNNMIAFTITEKLFKLFVGRTSKYSWSE